MSDHTTGKGNKHGDIVFGHNHEDGVNSAAIIRSGKNPNHYISLDSEGTASRKNGTMCMSPGSFQVKAGKDVTPNGTENFGIYLDAESGDLVLNARSGKIRLSAKNIELVAKGENGKNGVIVIDGSEKVLINSQIIDIQGKVSTKIVSEGTVNLIGRAILDIYGGLIDVADGATSIKGSKGGSSNEDRNK